MQRKRPRFTRVGQGYKCPKCDLEAFPARAQFYRHWRKVHPDAESNSGSSSRDSGNASSGSDVQKPSEGNSADRSGGTPGTAMPTRTRSASVEQSISRAASQGVDETVAQQGDMVGTSSQQAVVPDQGRHPDDDACVAQGPEQVEGNICSDAVSSSPHQVMLNQCSAACQRPAHSQPA